MRIAELCSGGAAAVEPSDHPALSHEQAEALHEEIDRLPPIVQTSHCILLLRRTYP